MRVRHPYALSDDPPAPDSRVHIGGRRDTHPVDDDGVITVPDDVAQSTVEAWAAGYGYDLSELVVDDAPETCDTVKTDGDVCGRELPCPYHTED